MEGEQRVAMLAYHLHIELVTLCKGLRFRGQHLARVFNGIDFGGGVIGEFDALFVTDFASIGRVEKVAWHYRFPDRSSCMCGRPSLKAKRPFRARVPVERGQRMDVMVGDIEEYVLQVDESAAQVDRDDLRRALGGRLLAIGVAWRHPPLTTCRRDPR